MALILRLLAVKTVRLRLIWFAIGMVVSMLIAQLTAPAGTVEVAQVPPAGDAAIQEKTARLPADKPSADSLAVAEVGTALGASDFVRPRFPDVAKPDRSREVTATDEPVTHPIAPKAKAHQPVPSHADNADAAPAEADAETTEADSAPGTFMQSIPALFSVRTPSEPEAPKEAEAKTADTEPPAASKPNKLTVRSGDTFSRLLQESGASHESILAVSRILREHEGFNPARVYVGQEITLNLGARASVDAEARPIDSIIFKTAPDKLLVAWRNDEGEYAVREKDIPLERKTVRLAGTIKGSLFESARKEGVPLPVIGEIINAYSYTVDFQRQIHSGDTFEVLLNQYHRKDGKRVPKYELQYASLGLRGHENSFYRFEKPGGGYGYFNASGESIEKSLLKTPIDGARLSSGFGMRKHPILGYSKMHKGVDFAAPTGVPIYAAGDGVVEFVGTRGGYGKYVRIRHNSKYQTAYAHASRYAKGIKPGVRVTQRQVIAYVGNTGRSTGPHLHFEILKDGKHVDPRSVKSPPGIILEGRQLAAFKAKLSEVKSQLASLRGPAETEFARQDERSVTQLKQR